jgi:SNF2 family DNA or RNA helicase
MLILPGKNKDELIVACNDRDKLAIIQAVTDGRKVRGNNQIIIHKKAAVNLIRIFNDIQYQDTQLIVKHACELYTVRIDNMKMIKKSDGTKFNYDYKGIYPEVMKHQKIMYNAIMYTDCCALLADPGTCKTGPYIWAIDRRIKDGKIKRCLIITLSSLKENVLREISIQAPHLKAVTLYDKATADKIINKKYKIKKYNQDYDVYIANYESMFSLVEIFDNDFFDMVICDEAHRIGSPQARQTKSIIDKFENVKYKYIISGTLNANNLMSFFMPFRFLGADTIPVSNYNSYRAQHMFTVDPDGYVWKPISKNDIQYTSKIIGLISLSFKKEECIDLPPLIREYMYCTMCGEQRKVYEDLKNEFLAIIDDMCKKCDRFNNCNMQCQGELTAKNALVLTRKLQQVASGYYINTRFLINEDGSEIDMRNIIYFEYNAKLQLLLEVMGTIPDERKTIIWSYSIPALEIIKKNVEREFGDESCLTCYGNQDAFKQINAFRENEKINWLIGNPAKMGSGHNIQFSNFQIFFDNSFSYIMKDQAESRQHRQGQKEKVTVIELITRDTIDERVVRVIDDKKDLSLTLSQWAQVFRKE